MARFGVYIKVNGHYRRVVSYRHWSQPCHTESHSKAAPIGKIYTVKCPDCDGSDFTDDGRYCNEYSCANCVESYVEVYFSKEY